jgi:hypothetical protein
MTTITRAQPIRPYRPPISIVWTRGEPAKEQDCAVLTTALRCGDAEIVERGHWGPYNAILRWTRPDEKPRSFLVDVQEEAPTDAR